MRALVTGASGFLGRYLVAELLRSGWDVCAIDRARPEAGPVPDGKAKWIYADLPGPVLSECVEEHPPQVFLHLAGPNSVPRSMSDPFGDFSGCVPLWFFCLDTLRRLAPDCKAMYFSSAAVYGNPESLPIRESHQPRPIAPYGFHKLLSENVMREFHQVYGQAVCGVRIFSAYGPGLKRQLLWDICRKALEQGEICLFGSGNETRDFIHARDVARSVILLLQKASFSGEIYNIANGEQVAVREIVQKLAPHLGDPPIRFSGEGRTGDPTCWQADNTLIRSLGYAPSVELADGLKEYALWAIRQLQPEQ